MVAKTLLNPCPKPGIRSKGLNSTFSKDSHLAYPIKGNCKRNNMQAHILNYTNPRPLGWAQLSFFVFFSSHVAYQINVNGAKSTMQPHILTFHTPFTLILGSKCHNILLKIVVLDIKLKRMDHRAPCKHISCLHTHTHTHIHSTPGMWVKSLNMILMKIVMFYIKIKRMLHHARTYCCFTHILTHTHGPLGGVKRLKHFFFLKEVMMHIKLKGMKHRTPCKHILCPNTSIPR